MRKNVRQSTHSSANKFKTKNVIPRTIGNATRLMRQNVRPLTKLPTNKFVTQSKNSNVTQ